MPQFCQIGKLAATFGLKGQLILDHKLGKKSNLKGLEALFVEMKGGEMLPYFLEEATGKNATQTFIKLEGVNTREAAQQLVSRAIWLPEDQFKKFAAKSAPISWLGYHIIDRGQPLGEVLEVIEQAHQLLCRITWKGKDALIPVHEDFLQKIDNRKKQIILELPEGLLEIYE